MGYNADMKRTDFWGLVLFLFTLGLTFWLGYLHQSKFGSGVNLVLATDGPGLCEKLEVDSGNANASKLNNFTMTANATVSKSWLVIYNNNTSQPICVPANSENQGDKINGNYLQGSCPNGSHLMTLLATSVIGGKVQKRTLGYGDMFVKDRAWAGNVDKVPTAVKVMAYFSQNADYSNGSVENGNCAKVITSDFGTYGVNAAKYGWNSSTGCYSGPFPSGCTFMRFKCSGQNAGICNEDGQIVTPAQSPASWCLEQNFCGVQQLDISCPNDIVAAGLSSWMLKTPNPANQCPPAAPTNTPTPTPGPRCGNGKCDSGEECEMYNGNMLNCAAPVANGCTPVINGSCKWLASGSRCTSTCRAVPVSTPTRTPIPTPTRTPTPTPTPTISCDNNCSNDANCQSGLTCWYGKCRNPNNPGDNRCNNKGEPNSCNGTCGSDSNCKPGLTCWYGNCRNPNNPASDKCEDKGSLNACNGTCGSDANCQSGLVCLAGFCRNPSCNSKTNCSCGEVLGQAVAKTTPKTGQNGLGEALAMGGFGGLAMAGWYLRRVASHIRV